MAGKMQIGSTKRFKCINIKLNVYFLNVDTQRETSEEKSKNDVKCNLEEFRRELNIPLYNISWIRILLKGSFCSLLSFLDEDSSSYHISSSHLCRPIRIQ